MHGKKNSIKISSWRNNNIEGKQVVASKKKNSLIGDACWVAKTIGLASVLGTKVRGLPSLLVECTNVTRLSLFAVVEWTTKATGLPSFVPQLVPLVGPLDWTAMICLPSLGITLNGPSCWSVGTNVARPGVALSICALMGKCSWVVGPAPVTAVATVATVAVCWTTDAEIVCTFSYWIQVYNIMSVKLCRGIYSIWSFSILIVKLCNSYSK